MATRITLATEIDIQFSDKDKAKAFFIDSDWSQTFYKYSDLTELCAHLAYMFHREADFLGGISIEGFGKFQRQPNDFWVSEYEEFGKIYVRVESDLEDTDTDEIEDFQPQNSD